MKTPAAILILALLAGCARPRPAESAANTATPANVETPATSNADEPDDNRMAAQVAADPSGAATAAQLVRTYYELIGQHGYAGARRLWGNDGQASNMTDTAFATSFQAYDDYHADVGAPGEPEGAAGSIYVEVPVLIYGRRAGQPFRMPGRVTLRRVNDVPGSTPAQRRWHIERIDLTSQA